MHGNATSPLDHRVRDYLVPGQRAKRLLIRNAGPYADPARNHSQRTARQQAGGQSPSDPGRRFPYGQGPQHVPAFPDARIYLRGFPHQLQPDGVAGARVLARTLDGSICHPSDGRFGTYDPIERAVSGVERP
jgi:hypothetical protein